MKWDSLTDALAVINDGFSGKWSWLRNNRCKYITLRIDMRTGSCLIYDRYGVRIDPETLRYQYGAADPTGTGL